MASDIIFPTGLIHRKVGPGAVLAVPLFVPELSRLASNRDAVKNPLGRQEMIENVLNRYLK